MWYIHSWKRLHRSLYLIALHSWYSVHPLVYQSGLAPQRRDDGCHLFVVEVIGRVTCSRWID